MFIRLRPSPSGLSIRQALAPFARLLGLAVLFVLMLPLLFIPAVAWELRVRLGNVNADINRLLRMMEEDVAAWRREDEAAAGLPD